MSRRTEVSIAPLKEPLTAAEVREHLRIDHEDDTNYMNQLIVAARKQAEETLNISLISQTVILWIDQIPCHTNDAWWNGARVGPISALSGNADFLEVQRGPVQSITTFETFDEDNNATVFDAANYYLTAPETNIPPARVAKKQGFVWPIPDREFDGIKITYVAGFGLAGSDVPMDLKQGMLMLIAHWYGLGRSAVLSGSITKEIELTLKDAWGKYYEVRF